MGNKHCELFVWIATKRSQLAVECEKQKLAGDRGTKRGEMIFFFFFQITKKWEDLVCMLAYFPFFMYQYDRITSPLYGLVLPIFLKPLKCKKYANPKKVRISLQGRSTMVVGDVTGSR